MIQPIRLPTEFSEGEILIGMIRIANALEDKTTAAEGVDMVLINLDRLTVILRLRSSYPEL